MSDDYMTPPEYFGFLGFALGIVVTLFFWFIVYCTDATTQRQYFQTHVCRETDSSPDRG